MSFDRFLLWNHANTYLARFSGTLTVVIGRHHFHPMVMNASLMTNNRHHCSISIVPFSCPNSTNQLRVISIQVQWTKENKSLTNVEHSPKQISQIKIQNNRNILSIAIVNLSICLKFIQSIEIYVKHLKLSIFRFDSFAEKIRTKFSQILLSSLCYYFIGKSPFWISFSRFTCTVMWVCVLHIYARLVFTFISTFGLCYWNALHSFFVFYVSPIFLTYHINITLHIRSNWRC